MHAEPYSFLCNRIALPYLMSIAFSSVMSAEEQLRLLCEASQRGRHNVAVLQSQVMMLEREKDNYASQLTAKKSQLNQMRAILANKQSGVAKEVKSRA